MLVLPKPTSKEFNDMVITCHDSVREVFKHYITDEDILSYSTDTTIVFLTKKEIADLWNRFTKRQEVNHILEPNDWELTYQEPFFKFVIRNLNKDVKDSARFFSHMMDEAYKVYLDQGWRLPTISELFSMCDRNQDICVNGFKTISNGYWSSTSYLKNDNYAWTVYFGNGYAEGSKKSNHNYVRCVRTVSNGLELAPSSKNKMIWQEAMNYAKTLQVDPKDIITVKQNGWCYEEVKPRKTYIVRVEVNVKECDLGEIEVKAYSKEEAIEKAIIECNQNWDEIDFWSSDYRETKLAVETKNDWEVTIKEEA